MAMQVGQPPHPERLTEQLPTLRPVKAVFSLVGFGKNRVMCCFFLVLSEIFVFFVFFCVFFVSCVVFPVFF